MNMEYFDYLGGLTMTNAASTQLFGGPPRAARSDDHPARDGPGALDPGGDRGDRAADGPPRAPSSPASATPAWPAAWRSTASPTGACCARGRSSGSGSSRRRATPAARSARRSTAGTRSSASRATVDGERDGMNGALPRPELRRRRDRGVPATRNGYPYERRSRTPSCAPRDRRADRRRQGGRAVPRAGWSSARERSGTARSSATRARRRCSRS